MSLLWQMPLADAEKLHSLGRQFRKGGSSVEPSQLLLWGGALLAVLIVAAIVAHRIAQRDKPGYHNPRRLFFELCKVHGLDRPKRTLLLNLARQQKLAHPSRLFLEPERFDTANLGPALAERRAEIQRVRDMMFGKRLKITSGR